MNEARLILQASHERLESSEKQVGARKDECRLIIIKGHEKEDRFEAELARMRTEVQTMTMELVELRFNASVRIEPDPTLLLKNKALEKEREELRSYLRVSEEQLDTIRREYVALAGKVACADPEQYVLKTDHVALLKRREAELLADMKTQLMKRSR